MLVELLILHASVIEMLSHSCAYVERSNAILKI